MKISYFQPEGGREFVRNQGGALNTPFCVYWEEEEEGAKMEALVAINWRGLGASERDGHRDLHHFLREI